MASLEHGRASGTRPIAAREFPLVDRIDEMKLLKEAVDRTIEGEGGLVFLYGEAGIGKTRLARELGAYAHLRGVRVLYGRCPGLFRMDGVPPYMLWCEVIRDYLDNSSMEQLYRVIGFYPAEVAKLVPEISQKLRAIPQSFPISPEQEQNRLFEAVSQFITNVSRETPLLVILDDLQSADSSSLLLLHYLARGVYRTPLLLLCAYRSTDVDAKHPLTSLLADLKRELLPQSVSLKRMPLDDTSEMIRQILEQDDIPAVFCNLIYEKTRGNPFFAEEVIKSLKEEEIIYREKGKWKIKEVSRIEFPETVKNVIKTRISRLDDECQNVLTLASFIGNDFSFEALLGVTGIDESKLLELLERILRTGLLKEKVIRGEDVYCFADVIVRDAVHEEVSQLRHKRLHGTIGHALEKTYSKKIDEHFGQLAYNFLESGDRNKALDYFRQAGEKSLKTYAYNEAFSYFDHALRLLEDRDGCVEEMALTTERLGDIKAWTGQLDNGIEHWDRALTLWKQLGDRKSVSRLHVKMAHAFWDVAGDKKKAAEHHQMALEILEKELESTELANLYEDIGHRLWRSGEFGALSYLKKAIHLAEKLGNARVLAESYNDLAVLSCDSGELEKTLRYGEHGLKIALESDSLEAALSLYSNLWSWYWWTGDPRKAFETVQKGLELAKRVGNSNLLAWLECDLAFNYWSMGEVKKALSLNEDILASAKRTRNASFVPFALNGIGRCYLWLGEWSRSRQCLTEAVNVAKEAREYGASADANLRLGELFMEMEDYEGAENYLKESNSIREEAKDTTSQLVNTFPALSRLYLKKGQIEKGKELIEKTFEFAVNSKNSFLIANAEMLEGMLFREQKNWEQSIQHFAKSLQAYRDLDARKWYVPYFANVLFEYASMFLVRNEEDDKEKARDLLNQALEIFQKMGAKKGIEKVEARIAFLETGKLVLNLKPINHVPTGYADLDELIYGGIPSNRAVILTSPSCDERDLLIKSFLEAGAKNGEIAFYVTINPGSAKTLAEDFQSNFFLFVCNPQADAIVKDWPNVVKLRGVENLTDISIALTSAIRKLDPSLKGARRICLDLLSDVLLQHHAVQTRRWFAGLIPELQAEGFTTLAVIDPQVHPSEELYAILGLFDGEISIHEKKTEKGPRKFLKIQKMSGQEYLENELLLKKEDFQKRE